MRARLGRFARWMHSFINDVVLAGLLRQRAAVRLIDANTQRILDEGVPNSDDRRKLDLSTVRLHREEEEKRIRNVTEKARMAFLGVTLTLAVYFPSIGLISSIALPLFDGHVLTVILLLVSLSLAALYFLVAAHFGIWVYSPAQYYFFTIEREAESMTDEKKVECILEVIDLNRQWSYRVAGAATVSMTCIRNGLYLSVIAATIILWLAFIRQFDEDQVGTDRSDNVYNNIVLDRRSPVD